MNDAKTQSVDILREPIENEKCYHPGCMRKATRRVWTTQGNGSALLPFCDQHPNAREGGANARLSDRA